MGYNVGKLQVQMEISSHNSYRDLIDRAIWEAFCKEVDNIAKTFNEEYKKSLEVEYHNG